MAKNRMKAPIWPEKEEEREYGEAHPSNDTRPHVRIMACTSLAEVIPEYVKFLWNPYIPAGKLTIIEGDPGIGKTWVSMALASAIAGGQPLPGMQSAHTNQKVLFCTAEDGLADTLVPRLLALGTDIEALSNIFAPTELFTLDATGIARLEETMIDYAAGIVFIDPLVAYLGAKMDMNKANEVREVMAGLAAVAERTGAAIIAIRHLRKAGGGQGPGKEIYAGMGSIDFTAAARSVVSVTQDKLGTNIISHIKSNLAFKGPRLTYAIDYTEDDGVCPFKWTGEYVDPSLDDGSDVCTTQRKRDDCATLLFDLLRDGEQPASEMKEACLSSGYKMGTIKNAKREAGVESKKLGNGNWVWYLEAREGLEGESNQT